jgi:hypothetical protein
MKKIVTGNYRSYNELVKVIHSYLQSDLTPIMKQVAEDIKGTLYDYIQTNWYNARPATSYYDRIYEFINSLSISNIKTVGNRKEVSIYFDESKIGSYETSVGMWNQHMDIYGNGVGGAIVGWINTGENSPLYSIEGIHFIDEILNNSDKFIKEVADLLEKKGYICQVK